MFIIVMTLSSPCFSNQGNYISRTRMGHFPTFYVWYIAGERKIKQKTYSHCPTHKAALQVLQLGVAVLSTNIALGVCTMKIREKSENVHAWHFYKSTCSIYWSDLWKTNYTLANPWKNYLMVSSSVPYILVFIIQTPKWVIVSKKL